MWQGILKNGEFEPLVGARIFIQIYSNGGFYSKDTGEFLFFQNKYSKSLSWTENLNKLFTVLGGKFEFSAQDSDLEQLFWRSKILQSLLT